MANLRSCIFLCRGGLQLTRPLRAARGLASLSSKTYTRGLFGSNTYQPYTLTCAPPKYLSVQTRPLSKTRAVIFDLGGVVVPSPQPIFDQFEAKHGLEQGSIVATIKAKGENGAFAKMERGEITVEGFCEPFRDEYAQFTGVELSMEQVEEFIGSLADFTKLDPNREVMDAIEWLKTKGIKVAILTNNFKRDNGETVFPRQPLNGIDVVS